MKYLILLLLVSCASYTDPEQEKLTYYKCKGNHEIVVKHSDDYGSVAIKYNKDQQVLLHHFVNPDRTGYHTDKLLWLTSGEKGVLLEKLEDGTERPMFEKCVDQNVKLQY